MVKVPIAPKQHSAAKEPDVHAPSDDAEVADAQSCSVEDGSDGSDW